MPPPLVEGVLILSSDLTILYANAVAAELAGCELNELVGKTCYKVNHHREERCEPSLCPCPIRLFQETGKPWRIIHSHLDDRAWEFAVAVSAYPTNDEE